MAFFSLPGLELEGWWGVNLAYHQASHTHERVLSFAFFLLPSSATFLFSLLIILLNLPSPSVWHCPSPHLRTSLSVLVVRLVLLWDGKLPMLCKGVSALVVWPWIECLKCLAGQREQEWAG